MFIDDILSLWTSSKQEISHFVDFANRFHATIKSKFEKTFYHSPPLTTQVSPKLRDPYDELVFYH